MEYGQDPRRTGASAQRLHEQAPQYSSTLIEERNNYSATLKRVQINYEKEINRIVASLDQRALQRQNDCKECVNLSKAAGRMTQRWRNMTSLSVETFALMNSQINSERSAIQELELELLQQNKSNGEQQKENNKLKKLVDILERKISEADGAH